MIISFAIITLIVLIYVRVAILFPRLFEKRVVCTKLDIYFLLYIDVIVKMSITIFLLELEGTQSEGFE
jgi:hypothetical protein